MKPHRTIANRPMSVAACDVAWPSSGLQELPVGWFAPESEGGLLVRVHGLQPTHRPPRVSDSAESDTPATCDAANPITPGTAPTAESTTPSDAATPAVSAAKSMRPASTQPHASRTSTARRRAHVAHDQIIQRHTEHVAKHQQLVTNVAFHATILRLHCDSQPNFATQPTVARREVGFTGLLRQ